MVPCRVFSFTCQLQNQSIFVLTFSEATTTLKQIDFAAFGAEGEGKQITFDVLNTSLDMEEVHLEEKNKAWYCFLCSSSLAPDLQGQDGVLLETARFA